MKTNKKETNNQKMLISGALVLIAAAVVMFLLFNGKKFEVKFDSNGGTAVGSQKVAKDDKVKEPTEPTKEGFTFSYWELNSEKYDFDSKVTKDLTLVAKYIELIKHDYTVMFDTNGGSIIESQLLLKTEKVKKPANPTKEGFVFLHWELNEKKYDFDSKVTKDLKLVAIWEKEKEVIPETIKFKVTFNSNGGSKVSTKTVSKDTKVSKPKNPSKKGYTFDGWYLNDALYNFNNKVTKDLTLTARWKEEIASYTIKQESFQLGSPQVQVFVLKNGTKVSASSVLSSSGSVIGTYNNEFNVILADATDYPKITKAKLSDGTIVEVKIAK